jgi:hypothetical protein
MARFEKFETVTLPKALVKARADRKKLEYESLEIATKLDFDDEWSGHDCDCEYCESNDRGELSRSERIELEDRLSVLESKIISLDEDIARMTRYKHWVDKAAN